MSSSKQISPNSNWQNLIYIDETKGPCVDLIVDTVKRQYPVPDLVCLVYHGPRPENCVSRVIDISKPSTPDNVGWISKDAALSDRREGSTEKEIKRRMIRPKMRIGWNELFHLKDDGALYVGGWRDSGEWKLYPVADILSKSHTSPGPPWESYAFIIDMSKPIWAENVAWMIQNPGYRTVYG
jgi:hypothetical protein